MDRIKMIFHNFIIDKPPTHLRTLDISSGFNLRNWYLRSLQELNLGGTYEFQLLEQWDHKMRTCVFLDPHIWEAVLIPWFSKIPLSLATQLKTQVKQRSSITATKWVDLYWKKKQRTHLGTTYPTYVFIP